VFYERVLLDEGPSASQLRRVQVNVTGSQPGDTVIKDSRGKWVAAPAEAGTDGPAIALLRTRVDNLTAALAALAARVAAVEDGQIIVEVGSESQGFERVHVLRIDVETGDVSGQETP
jgi:hypothetical protein